MSQSVNISACPFHRYMHTDGPHTHVPTPPRCRAVWPPSRFTVHPQLRLLMEKVTLARWPVIWGGPAGSPKQAKHNPNKTPGTRAAFAELLLEWYSVSRWALVNIHLRVYGQPRTTINRCLTRLKRPLLCQIVTSSNTCHVEDSFVL